METIFDKARKNYTTVTIGRKSTSNKNTTKVNSSKNAESGLSKGVRKRKNKAERKRKEAERVEFSNYLENKRKKIVDSYNSKDLGVSDKKIIKFSVDLDINGYDNEVIARIINIRKMYKEAISVEICTRMCGYEEFRNVAEISRYETITNTGKEKGTRKLPEKKGRLKKEMKKCFCI